MKKENWGGPAFPGRSGNYGMSLRDWFAGMALQGMLASGETGHVIIKGSYARADAMLEEREKEES